jgi:hypothetical protein
VALNLFGVTVNDAHVTTHVVSGIETIAVRDLAAICGQTDYHAMEADEQTVRRYADVVADYGTRGPVLPAPVGIVFRGSDSVQRWLELHYGALTDALSFVENRVAGRVHVWRNGAGVRDASLDVDALAAESLRALRRAAVATIPLRVEGKSGIVLSAAFLVEQELWKDFLGEVEAQKTLVPSVRFELTGPWPPYDFVQMQLGA